MIQMGISLEDIHKELASRHVIDKKVKQEKMTKYQVIIRIVLTNSQIPFRRFINSFPKHLFYLSFST